MLGLLSLGVIMVQSASTTVTNDLAWQWSLMGAKHLRFAIGAVLTYLVVSRFDYALLGKRAKSVIHSPVAWAVAAAMIACTVVLVPGIGSQINGARHAGG